MNKILLITIIFIFTIVLGIIIYLYINSQPSSTNQPLVPVTTSDDCPKIEDNKDSNYTFSNTPTLGSEILESLKEKFSFLFKENFILSTNIITDINILDINKYYYIGIRNASGENPGCIVQFPLQVYKLA